MRRRDPVPDCHCQHLRGTKCIYSDIDVTEGQRKRHRMLENSRAEFENRAALERGPDAAA